MFEVRLVRRQAKRARCSLPQFVQFACQKFGGFDADAEHEKIVRHLKSPAAAKKETPIARPVVRLAELCEGSQRPQDIIRGID